MWTNKWLRGSIRKYPVEIRGVWPDLQAMADESPVRGKIMIAEGVPYTPEQLSLALNIPREIYDKAIAIFIKEKYIRIDNGIIELLQWTDLQSDYQRQKKYRKVTTKSYNQKLQEEVTNSSISISKSSSESNSILKHKHKEFISIFHKYWLGKREGEPQYFDKDFNQLATLLKSNPTITGENWLRAIQNSEKDIYHYNSLSLGHAAINYSKLLNLKTKKEIEEEQYEVDRKRREEVDLKVKDLK